MPSWVFRQVTRLFTDPIERPENPFILFRKLSRRQWVTFLTAFLGWSLDAMDYFILTLAVPNIAAEFALADPTITKATITDAIIITLLFRPIGALLFGIAGDRFGRRFPLMIDILLYSAFEVASGFARDLPTFLVLRGFFGVAMGGEWGLGAALALESLPPECRGLFSGILQQGYAFGNLLAAALFYIVAPALSWRALFWIGGCPAVLLFLLRFFVSESEAFTAQHARRQETGSNFVKNITVTFRLFWQRTLYCIVLMSAFNFLSHGSQDLYPTHVTSLGFTDTDKAVTVAIASTGSLIGGTILGYVGQYFGRRRTVFCSAFMAGIMIYPWAFCTTLPSLRASAFFMQFFVQGAWGVVPAHLNELAPPGIRATFPGLVYNLGNMISASSASIEARLGEKYPSKTLDKHGKPIPNYALTQAVVMIITVSALLIAIATGAEERHINLQTGSVDVDEDEENRGARRVLSSEYSQFEDTESDFPLAIDDRKT